MRLRGAGLDLRGHLPEAFGRKTQAFSGTLADGQPFSLAIVASYLTRSVIQGPFLEVSSETPFFLTAPWRRINTRLEGFVRAPAAYFTQDAQELAARGELDDPYTYEGSVTPTRLTRSVLSLLETRYVYTGGAHPNTDYRSLTFRRVGERTVRVTLRNLFRDGTPYRRVLLSEVNCKLRARRAAWIVDGSVTLKERDLNVFTLTSRGLEFVFAPYAVGPYAQGVFFVTVSYDALKNLLKPAFLP
ncbi:MAG: Bll3052 protein [uncultured Truepera sp.]|uniref:Bll3052 protein n=1 Tax=uncultured Truepera sp. TaxID=543023 RepID=A0A6J4VHV8_9DEIN|nr:MAG: Bll3052 protein [uncultured Truepera sp.]